jgi:hypothetical protein
MHAPDTPGLELPGMDIPGIAASCGVQSERVKTLPDLTAPSRTRSHPTSRT